MSTLYQIESVSNGFIVNSNRRQVFKTIEEVFEDILMHFEGRCATFTGRSYGRVTVERSTRDEKEGE